MLLAACALQEQITTCSYHWLAQASVNVLHGASICYWSLQQSHITSWYSAAAGEARLLVISYPCAPRNSLQDGQQQLLMRGLQGALKGTWSLKDLNVAA